MVRVAKCVGILLALCLLTAIVLRVKQGQEDLSRANDSHADRSKPDLSKVRDTPFLTAPSLGPQVLEKRTLDSPENAGVKAQLRAAQNMGGADQWQDSEEALRRLYEQHPDQVEIVYALATAIFMREKVPIEAMELMEKGIQLNPDFPNIFDRYVEVAKKANSLDAASDFLKNLKPNADVLMALGLSYTQSQRRDEAIAAYHEAVKFPSDRQSFAYAHLGNLYQVANRHDEAAEALEYSVASALRYNKTNTTSDHPKDHQSPLSAQLTLLRLYLDKQDLARAEELLLTLQASAPDHNAVQMGLDRLRSYQSRAKKP